MRLIRFGFLGVVLLFVVLITLLSFILPKNHTLRAITSLWVPRDQQIETVHCPIFSSDGSFVYFLVRSTSLRSWGPGLMNLTPPAKIWIREDKIQLMRWNKFKDNIDVIRQFELPHAKSLSQWRHEDEWGEVGSLSGFLGCYVGWDQGRLNIDLTTNVVGSMSPTLLSFDFDPSTNSWITAGRPYITKLQDPESVFSNNEEVINYRWRALFLDKGKSSSRTMIYAVSLAKNDLNERGASLQLAEFSHRKEVERTRDIRAVREKHLEDFRSGKISEAEAYKLTHSELVDRGIYSKEPQLIANLVSSVPRQERVFSISDAEFQYGLFQDIEKAVRQPGHSVPYGGGRYIKHRDFTTSDELNVFLQQGNKRFYVRRQDGTVFELRIQ